ISAGYWEFVQFWKVHQSGCTECFSCNGLLPVRLQLPEGRVDMKMTKKLFAVLALLGAFALPALAQWRLSPDDQQRFDSYYSRWQEYRQRSDFEQTQSMQRRMLDVYAHYGIPPQTPFWRVASRARGEHDRWMRRLPPNDQARFDSYFSRWQQYRQARDRDQVASMERRMQDIYSQYRIPPNTPYWWVASNAGPNDH